MSNYADDICREATELIRDLRDRLDAAERERDEARIELAQARGELHEFDHAPGQESLRDVILVAKDAWGHDRVGIIGQRNAAVAQAKEAKKSLVELLHTEPGYGHPWHNFLQARIRALVWLRDEVRATPDQIARTMSMDSDQVQQILHRHRHGR